MCRRRPALRGWRSMPERDITPLSAGYACAVDAVDEAAWYKALSTFDDANIYQTWAYGAVLHGERSTRRLVLRRHGDIAALAQVRVVRVPLLPAGVAYVRWGPVSRRGSDGDIDAFRQAIRALRNEFACRRGLVVRLLPMLFADSAAAYAQVLTEEGFQPHHGSSNDQTLVMDLRPPLDGLRAGMKTHWKRELRAAEKTCLEVEEGTDDTLFAAMVGIHRELVARKRFVEGNDINAFRRVQARLPGPLKMNVMLCRSGGAVMAGMVFSVMGRTGVYLFGATSNQGMRSRGSYLLQWSAVQRMKADGVVWYDLNGINPRTNPGTYKFKSDLAGANGREVQFLGRYDARVRGLSGPGLDFAEAVRAGFGSALRAMRRASPLRP